MNALDWLKSVREKAQKTLIPPDPPEGVHAKNSINALIPPETPCASTFLNRNEIIFQRGETEKNTETKAKTQTSGCHRGNTGFYRGNEDSTDRGDRRNQENMAASEVEPPPVPPPLPYITADGTLVIPYTSDPKYHWWRDGQSVDQTRAEALARIKANRRLNL